MSAAVFRDIKGARCLANGQLSHLNVFGTFETTLSQQEQEVDDQTDLSFFFMIFPLCEKKGHTQRTGHKDGQTLLRQQEKVNKIPSVDTCTWTPASKNDLLVFCNFFLPLFMI